MAEINAVRKLDLKLLENKIIDPEYRLDYKLVHNMLNSHARKNGKILTETTFLKGDEKLRNWLMTLYKKGASQEKLTSYLRSGLAHLCYDFIESTYKRIPEEDLISRALSSFKLRKFNTSFFRVAKSELKAKKKKPVKKSIKKKPVKKIITKKVLKKTAVGKRPVSKKKTTPKIKKPLRSIKKITKKIIKKTKPSTKKKTSGKRIVKIKLTSRSISSNKKPRSISSKLQSFLKRKKIIKKMPSSYWKDK